MSNLLYFVEREYPVGISRLWNAWVKADELESWYSPVFLEVIKGSATSDAKVGGSWAIAVDVSANGFNAYFWGTYKEVEANSKITHTLNYSQDELEFNLREEQPEAHLIEVVFEDRGEKSWVRFSQFGEMDPEQAEASREGMESYLENLAIFLSS
jgi:uncharacterized protein YndB with AHSA1/START domain